MIGERDQLDWVDQGFLNQSNLCILPWWCLLLPAIHNDFPSIFRCYLVICLHEKQQFQLDIHILQCCFAALCVTKSWFYLPFFSPCCTAVQPQRQHTQKMGGKKNPGKIFCNSANFNSFCRIWFHNLGPKFQK